MSGPSDKAVAAARHAAWHHAPTNQQPSSLVAGLAAAHDPALGLDRSVCLRDVVEFLRARDEEDGIPRAPIAATQIKREFGGAA